MKKHVQMNLRVSQETKKEVNVLSEKIGKKSHEIVEIAVSRLLSEVDHSTEKNETLYQKLSKIEKKLTLLEQKLDQMIEIALP